MTDPITSPANQRIKDLVRLRNRRDRDATGRFAVEGFRELTRAVDGGVRIHELFVCPELFLGENEPLLAERIADSGADMVLVAEEPFRKASYRDRPEGLLAVAERFDVSLSHLDLSGEPLLLVAESIEKPGNLGTMLRAAEGAGARAVIVADPTTDPFNPNVVRASLGTVFTVPLAIADTPTTLDFLAEHGVQVLAATPDGAIRHFDADMRGPVALVVGSEQYGLTDAWLEGSAARVVIPMPGSMDSLNAAMAAGILLFEAVRQRMT